MYISPCRSANTGVFMCRSLSLIILSLLLQQYPACLVHFTWMVCEMVSGHIASVLYDTAFLDLFKTAYSNLV